MLHSLATEIIYHARSLNSIIHNLEDGVTIIISKHCEPIVDVASSPTLHQRHRQHIVALFQKSLVP